MVMDKLSGGKVDKFLFFFFFSFSLLFSQRIILGDDFSTFPDSWNLGGTSNEYWTKKESRWYSHSFSVKSTPHLQYHNNVSVWMERRVNFSDYDIGCVTFWLWQETEEGDFLEFLYSTDNGTTWTIAWERDGSYPFWQFISISEIPNSVNRIRFRFSSDSTGEREGVYIDDLVAYGIRRTLNVLFYDGMDDFPANWTLWGNYQWTRVNNRYSSAPYSAKCAPINGYGYYNNQNNGIDRFFNLSNYDYGLLRFSFYRHLEQGRDSIYVKYRLRDTWRILMTRTGRYQQWAAYSFILPREADGIRFHFKSNDTITYDGVYLDDVILYGISTPRIDIWTVAITQPPAAVDSGSVVSVQAEIGNNSPAIAGSPVYYQIGNFYRAMVLVDPIYPYATSLVNFPEWVVNCPPGTYQRRCTTAYFNDYAPGNDCQIGLISVNPSSEIEEGIEEEKNREIKIFPNPAKKNSVITCQLPEEGIYTLKVVNILGKVLYSQTLLNEPFRPQRLPMKNLPSGVYLLLLEREGKRREKRFILLP